MLSADIVPLGAVLRGHGEGGGREEGGANDGGMHEARTANRKQNQTGAKRRPSPPRNRKQNEKEKNKEEKSETRKVPRLC